MEKNIKEYNKDITDYGSYLYSKNKFSSKVATKRQSDEIIRLIRKYFSRKIKILDVGCGDGEYTLEVYKRTKPRLIVGIDSAKNAISVAKKIYPGQQEIESVTN